MKEASLLFVVVVVVVVAAVVLDIRAVPGLRPGPSCQLAVDGRAHLWVADLRRVPVPAKLGHVRSVAGRAVAETETALRLRLGARSGRVLSSAIYALAALAKTRLCSRARRTVATRTPRAAVAARVRLQSLHLRSKGVQLLVHVREQGCLRRIVGSLFGALVLVGAEQDQFSGEST